MKNYIDLVLLAALFFTFNIMADSSPKVSDFTVQCKTTYFTGGPLTANFTIKEKLTDFTLSCPVGQGSFKRPEFPEFDDLLMVIGKIEKDDYVESFTFLNFDTSKCSHASSLPTLIRCRKDEVSPLLLVVRNKNNTSSYREIVLQTENPIIYTARRVYEQASGKEVSQGIDYTVALHFSFVSENKNYYQRIESTFHGKNGCVVGKL